MITTGPRTLSDGTVTLREVRDDDAKDLYEWRMDPRTRAMFHSTAAVPYETHLRFVEAYFRPENDDAWFVVETDGLAVGTIVLYNIARDGREAEWGRFVIAPHARGRGLGKKALALLIGYADGRGIRRLRCDVLASNTGARLMYRELGFVETGQRVIGGRTFVEMLRDEQAGAG